MPIAKILFDKARFDKRLAMALAILGALVLLIANEGAYRQSKEGMDTLVARGSSRTAILKLTESLINAEASQRAFVATGQESLLKDLGRANTGMQNSLRLLTQDHGDEPGPMGALERLRAKVQARVALLNQGVALRREGKLEEAYAVMKQNDSTTELIQSLDNELMAFEDEGLEQRRSTVYRSMMMARISVAVMIAVGVVFLLMSMRRASALRFRHIKRTGDENDARADLQAQVALRTAELTDLTRYLLVNREDERSRLARNLHDDLGGLLTSAKLDVARIKTRITKSSPDSLELLAHLVTSLDGCVALGREIIEDLRPSALSNLGLVATLEIMTKEFAKNSGIDARCELEPVTLNASADLVVYRVVQEALTNIAKYAKASLVTVILRPMGDQLQLEVLDNGMGFDLHAKLNSAYGLLGMRFRVEAESGTLRVTSAPGEGTQIVVTMPIPTADLTPALR